MIPISLMVTIEIVKVVQMIYFMFDSDISDSTHKVKVQSFNINEDLGQIQYILSDKTGTLTCNNLEFKEFTIGIYLNILMIGE